MVSKKMPRAGILLFAALLAACATSIREPVDPSSPLSEPSPPLEAGIETFFRLNLGERIDALALSGGGQNGAYGVGLIKGWREIGIPHFDVITGVSTGALIASHVFLDSPEADRVIERFYTSVRRSDILCTRNPVLALGADSVASMVPLERLIENVVPDEVIEDVARASEGGKRLLMVGTVNLDTGGYRMWDLGAMARAGQYDKYRAVLRASAGPPVAVSPVYLEGEMHCDGSTASSVFIPFSREHIGDAAQARIEAEAARRGVPTVIPGTIYVVVNGLREPSEERVQPALLDIAERALDVMGYSNRLGNLWYVYARVMEAEGTYRLRFIPESLREEADDFLAFDPKLMRAIFEQGVKDGRNSDIWETKPPLLRPDR